MKKYIGMLGVVLGFAVTALALPEEKVIPYTEVTDEDVPGNCAFPENLVTNCGFETGNLTGWTQFGDTSFTGVAGGAIAYSGNWGFFSGPVNGFGGIFQNVATTAGQTYAVTFYLRNQGTPNGFRVSWNGTTVYSCDNCPNFPYTVFGFHGLMATGSSSEIRFSFFNPPDFFYMDDVIVVPCDQE